MSLACYKDYSIEIKGCVDWTQLSWGVASQLNGTFSPSSSLSDSFSATVSSDPHSVANIGLVTYNGPACNCNLHITYVGGIPANGGNCWVGISRVAPFLSLLCWAQPPKAPGTYDTPFVIPDTLGIARQFRVTVNIPNGFGVCSIAAQITSV